MANRVVITIGREYGSGGHIIAEQLAKKLNIPMFDKNIIALASERSGIEESRLQTEDEKVANPFFEPYVPYGIDTGSLSERLFLLQSTIIKEKAREQSCIFVGRCSDVVLEHFDHTYHFFIYAPKKDRIKRIMELDDIKDEYTAAKIVKKIDKQRKSYYQFYTDRKWGSYADKDLVMNSSTLGLDGCTDLIISYLKLKGELPVDPTPKEFNLFDL